MHLRAFAFRVKGGCYNVRGCYLKREGGLVALPFGDYRKKIKNDTFIGMGHPWDVLFGSAKLSGFLYTFKSVARREDWKPHQKNL